MNQTCRRVLSCLMSCMLLDASDSGATCVAQVVADGVAKLDAESFVAMNRFSVKEGCEPQFEKRFGILAEAWAVFFIQMPEPLPWP